MKAPRTRVLSLMQAGTPALRQTSTRSSLLSHVRGFRFQFAEAFRRTAFEHAADFRASLVDRAGKVGRTIWQPLNCQRAAVSAAHFHERAITDEMRELVRIFAELRPIVAGDPDVLVTL